jgi:hypothetical protein
MDGEGRTLTEAKKDAGRKIEEALARPYQPMFLQVREERAIVWTNPYGFCYGLLEKGLPVMGSGISHCSSREDALQAARRHLLQITWEFTDGTSHPYGSAEENRELESWFKFQIAYRVSRNRGMTDLEAHAYASSNPRMEDL